MGRRYWKGGSEVVELAMLALWLYIHLRFD
jgi:hypothetical protein